MRESAQDILREVLSEQMNTEAGGVPPTDEIRKIHTFSASFLKKMCSLVKRQERELKQAEQPELMREEKKQVQKKQAEEERAERELGQVEQIQAEQPELMREEKEQAQEEGEESQKKRVKEEGEESQEKRGQEEGEESQKKRGQEEGEEPQEKRGQEEGEEAQEEQKHQAERKVLRGFSAIQVNRATRRIAAACLVCVILLSTGILGYQGLLRAGRIGADSSASYSTAVTDGIGGAETAEEYDTGADAAEEETAEESVSAAGSETDGEDAGNGSNGESAGNEADENGAGNEDDEVSAGGENARDGVSLKVTNVTDYSATLEISNEAGEEVSYGETYELECYDDKTGDWVAVPLKNEVAYEEIAYIVPEGEAVTCVVDWSEAYGSLSEGTYRMVKEIWYCEEEKSYVLKVEFVIE